MAKMTLKNVSLVCKIVLSDVQQSISTGISNHSDFVLVLRDISWLHNLDYIDDATRQSLCDSAQESINGVLL